MEKEKNQKDVFQQHRCLHINDCQVSKKLINLDSLKWLQLGFRPSAPLPKHVPRKQCRSSHGPDLQRVTLCTRIWSLISQGRTNVQGAAANINANHNWQSPMMNPLVRKTFSKKIKISLISFNVLTNCCSFLILTCPDVDFVWCTTMH